MDAVREPRCLLDAWLRSLAPEHIGSFDAAFELEEAFRRAFSGEKQAVPPVNVAREQPRAVGVSAGHNECRNVHDVGS
jgi:hypothetical protein